METSRDKITETEGTTSIRLRYSRQFQHSGHTHTIDAETALAVGASSEKRELVIRELEAGVEQLARQITQRGSRATSEIRPPAAPVRTGATASRSAESPAPPRPASEAAQPTAPLPVSESMPATPIASGGRTINLPYFVDYIKKRWNMSPKEAMDLLNIHELSGLNLLEALYTLRAIKEPNSPPNPASAQARITQQHPAVEAPRQTNRSAPGAPNSRPPASQAAPDTAPMTRAPGSTSPTLRQETTALPRAVQTATVPKPEPAKSEREYGSRPDFAGSPKAPLPIQLGVVRDLAPRSPYGFEEEDGEEFELPADDNAEVARRQAAESKLEMLKNIRGDSAASPERLNVLNNVLDGQIREEQLKQLIKAVWGFTNKKRLKVEQVETLISWAKEDYFTEEVEKLLEQLDEGEE